MLLSSTDEVQDMTMQQNVMPGSDDGAMSCAGGHQNVLVIAEMLGKWNGIQLNNWRETQESWNYVLAETAKMGLKLIAKLMNFSQYLRLLLKLHNCADFTIDM